MYTHIEGYLQDEVEDQAASVLETNNQQRNSEDENGGTDDDEGDLEVAVAQIEVVQSDDQDQCKNEEFNPEENRENFELASNAVFLVFNGANPFFVLSPHHGLLGTSLEFLHGGEARPGGHFLQEFPRFQLFEVSAD